MIRALAISLLLLAAACSAQPSVARQPDNSCLNDCLGNGGERQFCEDRCTD